MGTVSSESPKVQYSVQREQSDGSLNRISVRVPYFSKDDIHVYVDDVEINSSASEQSTYTWRWDGDYIAITPNVASGSEVLVRRITPINEAIHIFDGRSEFDDQSMDENFQQLIYIAQEYSEGSGIKDVFSDINMHGYKITNVGWATDDDDIVTYGQYKKDAEGAKVAMQKAETAASKAEQHEQNTQAIANQAQTDITASKESAIKEITNRIAPEVDKARVHAVTAQSAAGTAVSASNRSETVLQHVQMLEDEAELHAGTAEAAKDESLRIKDELKSGLDLQEQIAPAVKVVADNIEHVRTDSLNINDINTVAADLEGTTTSSFFEDYGDLSNPGGGGTVITGGNIKTVSDNIEHVRTNSTNITDIKKVATEIDRIPETIKTMEGLRDEATASKNLSKDWATKIDDTVDGTEYSAKYYAIKAKTEGGQAVEQAVASAVQQVTDEGIKQINLAKAEVTKATEQANIATTQAGIATTKANEASADADSAHSSAVQADTSAKNSANSASSATAQATASANSAKEAKTSENNAASYKVASSNYANNAKSSEIEAKRQADLAKGYANQASSGQVNADWNETVPTSKAFIKNKPTLGALASKDSIAYSEITGTPPEQDLNGLATKNELQTGLASKANTKHTHTVAEITNLNSTLSGYVTTDTLTEELAKKANASHTHTKSQITDFPAIPDTSTLIPKSGNRGALAGYSSSATGTTVNATSGDSLYASANVTVANGATGQTWTKVVKLSAGTVTLGTNWSWVGGEEPELKYPCLLVCHWNQDKGIAGIVAGV